jgi:phenylalanyl-tRNA synthetase beta chain
MNVPLHWLSEFVTLPKSETELTDKLTMVGHMLDKRKVVGNSVVVDLELRGNRADMFGLIGVARDVSAIFDTKLTLPRIATLPKTDPNSPLVHADTSVQGLVKRYIAITLSVEVKPSPKWMADRLIQYGIEPINNIVDVTNYVMVETSHPMHAFDLDTLDGGTLHLKMAKAKQSFDTIAQGTTLALTPHDIAICDASRVQCITCIGGASSKVTHETKQILLETAVYDAASSRRTARRHKIATESGNRHEKHQDPEELPFALARAVYLLTEVAGGKVTSLVSDYYPKPVEPHTIEFYPSHLEKLVGIPVAEKKCISILKLLGFHGEVKKDHIAVTVPTFRTDVLQEADVIEEIIRIYGYEHIPVKTLSGELPTVGTPTHLQLQESVQTILKELTLNEVITGTLMGNDVMKQYEAHGSFDPSITLINSPDPQIATLRPSLLPNLVEYAKRSMNFRTERIALFEIGNIYTQPKPKQYKEHARVGMLMGGSVPSTWSRSATAVSFFDLKGATELLLSHLGIEYSSDTECNHPSYVHPSLRLLAGKTQIGSIGTVDPSLLKKLGISQALFYAELDLDKIHTLKGTPVQPYTTAPLYPPIVEDFSFVVPDKFSIAPCMQAMSALHPMITSVELRDIYEDKRMLRVLYSDPKKTLSGEDVAPIRKKLIELAEKKFGLILKTE